MQTYNLGPLMIPASYLPWIAGFFVAWLLAFIIDIRTHRRELSQPAIEPMIWWLLLGCLLGGRAGFLLRYGEHYSSWLQMFDPRDGGWWWPAALLGGLAVLMVILWRQSNGARKRLPIIISAALLLSLPLTLYQHQQIAPMQVPSITLQLLDTETHNLQNQPLDELVKGQITLVSLWASWCPHCRRQMPVLQQAVNDFPEVRLLLVNRGESLAQIQHYLHEHPLEMPYQLMDSQSLLSEHTNSPGLPTTLVFDQHGKLQARHTGALSSASLHKLLAGFL